MWKILSKRFFRDFKENIFKYTALFFLVLIAVFEITSIVGSAEIIIYRVNEHSKMNSIEDGEFTSLVKINQDEINELTKNGAEIEEQFYCDYKAINNSTLRIFKTREKINLIELSSGRMPQKDNEVVLEKNYANKNNINIGDTVQVSKVPFEVTGLGSTPDYDLVVSNYTDISATPSEYGNGFVTENAYNILLKNSYRISAETYMYAYRLNSDISNEQFHDLLKEIKINIDDVNNDYFSNMIEVKKAKDSVKDFEKQIELLSQNAEYENVNSFLKWFNHFKNDNFNLEIEEITSFVTRENNSRIAASIDDAVINKNSGIFAGVIVFILIAYMMSVFIVSMIDKDTSAIGTLYALGVTKKHLIIHYLFMPTVISLLGGITGTLIGFSPIGVTREINNSEIYYSLPEIKNIFPVYLLIYGILLPPIVSIIVNLIVINRKLSKNALSLIRNNDTQKVYKELKLEKFSFLRKFQIKQFVREIKSFTIIIGGMFISLILLMLGLNCYSICINIKENNANDVNFKNMYIFKYPTEEYKNLDECVFSKELRKEIFNNNLSVTLLGIPENSKYFDINANKRKNSLIISSSVANKYYLKIGDEFVLKDEEEGIDYAFTVDGIIDYSIGLYVFMDLDSMRELFNKDDDYYNTILSNDDLNIDNNCLYSVLTRDSIEKTGKIFIKQYKGLIITMLFSSIIMFFMVMFLIIKAIMDKSAKNISMIRILGYNDKRIKKLYLDGIFYVVIIVALICVPLTKLIMNNISPILCSNFVCGVDTSFQIYLYPLIFIGIVVFYKIINLALVFKIKKYDTSIILKNRE